MSVDEVGDDLGRRGIRVKGERQEHLHNFFDWGICQL